MKTIGKSVINLLKALVLPGVLYLILILLIPERIANWQSFTIIINMSIIPSIIACGMSFGWICGIIDFSIGSCIIFASLVGAAAGNLFGIPGLFLGAIAAALLIEAIISGVFRLLRIPSLVITLGMLMIFEIAGNRFAALVGRLWPEMSTGYYIRLNQNITFLGTPLWMLIVLLITLSIYTLVFYRTKMANQARVVGSDELIAKNVGIQPMQVKFKAWLAGGFFLGIAAALTAAYSGSATPQTNMTTLSAVFRPMMCVVIALSLQSLVPVPVGIFIGAFSMNIIFTGIIALGISDNMQNVMLGIFLIIVVASPKVANDIKLIRRRKTAQKLFLQEDTNYGL
ncbi:MAG: hypothetical protein LBM77_00785 [Spirochaetaceae bacterium]|jgi:ribose transport system permease protein|nr:hypothetical protein [Spirochaetaceae bacterium]